MTAGLDDIFAKGVEKLHQKPILRLISLNRTGQIFAYRCLIQIPGPSARKPFDVSQISGIILFVAYQKLHIQNQYRHQRL